MLTVRLEAISENYTVEMSQIFEALLPPLALPPLALPAAEEAGHAGLESARVERAGADAGYLKRLLAAVTKFDLSRHAPMPDKVAHVSDKDAKQALRETLLADGRLRPLLKALRQALGYDKTMPKWQPPPDVERLSEAIDTTVSAFWKKAVRSGEVGVKGVGR